MGGLWRVPASGGGKPELVTKPQPGEISHRLPQLLPDGQTVLFTSTKTTFPSWDDTRIVAQSLATGQQKVLIEGGADARYIKTGHLVYMRRGTLMAVPFDVDRLEVTGDAVVFLPTSCRPPTFSRFRSIPVPDSLRYQSPAPWRT